MAVDVAGPVMASRRNNLVMHDQYMKKYEEMQKTFSHRSLQLKREERELNKKLEAIVGKTESLVLARTIGLEPLPRRETSSKKVARARTPFPRAPATNFMIPSPPKERPKSTFRGRRLSRSSEMYETKSEGGASPLRQRSPERGQQPVTGHDAEKRKRVAALSRRRNTVCAGVLQAQLEKLSSQHRMLPKDEEFESPEEGELSKNQGNEEDVTTDQSDSESHIKTNEICDLNVAEESHTNCVIPKPKPVSAIFCYKYEEAEEETEGKSVLVDSKLTSSEQLNAISSNESQSSDSGNIHQKFPTSQESGNVKVSRKIAIMSPVQENDNETKEASVEQTNKTSSEKSVLRDNLNSHQNHSKPQQNGKFGRKIAVMSPVVEREWAEENSNDTNDDEKCICEVQTVNQILPNDSTDSRSELSQTISLAFSATNASSSDNSENSPKGKNDSKTKEWSTARPGSSLQRGRSPARRLSRSLGSSMSPPEGKARLMHRRRSLDPNMIANMKQFSSNGQQKHEQRQPPLNSLRRRSSVCDPSFQGIDMVGVEVGREKFKSIARRMLALSRGHQKDESDDANNTDDVPAEWRDIDKCRYLRTYVPTWDRG